MSEPITVLIAEDEDLIRAEMQRLLAEHWPAAKLVAAAVDGEHALELWEHHQPDVAFLDIQMPGMTGLQAAAHMSRAGLRANGKPPTQIVFATAYDQHALAAFEAGAVDYVLKPVRPARLLQVIDKLQIRLVPSAASQSTHALLRTIEKLSLQLASGGQAKTHTQWISASAGANIKLIAVKDVLYFQSDTKYTRLVTADGEALVRKSLRELLDELDGEVFKQVHRSTVVNLHAVASIARDGTGRGTLRFKGIKDEVDVSAAYLGQFRPV